jgi:hypothetical protein
MHWRIKMSPAVIAIIVAVVGQAAILYDFGPDKGSGSSNMTTAAAVARVGAIEIPVGSGNHPHGDDTTTAAAAARAGAIEIPVGP